METVGSRPSAHQTRSILTEDRLCEAAEAVLREGGLAACTMQAVAERSGRSAGSIYRRFGDKEGMIEAVIARYLGRTLTANEANLRLLAAHCPDLSSRLKALIGGAVAGRRRDFQLLAAFREAARNSAHPSLAASFARTRETTLDLAKRALEECADEIGHAGKPRAIEFAVAMLAAAVETMMRTPSPEIGDDVLRSELHTMLLGYLKGVTSNAAAKSPERRPGAP